MILFLLLFLECQLFAKQILEAGYAIVKKWTGPLYLLVEDVKKAKMFIVYGVKKKKKTK